MQIYINFTNPQNLFCQNITFPHNFNSRFITKSHNFIHQIITFPHNLNGRIPSKSPNLSRSAFDKLLWHGTFDMLRHRKSRRWLSLSKPSAPLQSCIGVHPCNSCLQYHRPQNTNISTTAPYSNSLTVSDKKEKKYGKIVCFIFFSYFCSLK